MSSYCVLACLDRQASLDEDALEVMAIKEAQTRARGTVRARGGRKAQQGARGTPGGARSSGGAIVEPVGVAAPKSATEGVMARWLARAAVQG